MEKSTPAWDQLGEAARDPQNERLRRRLELRSQDSIAVAEGAPVDRSPLHGWVEAERPEIVVASRPVPAELLQLELLRLDGRLAHPSRAIRTNAPRISAEARLQRLLEDAVLLPELSSGPHVPRRWWEHQMEEVGHRILDGDYRPFHPEPAGYSDDVAETLDVLRMLLTFQGSLRQRLQHLLAQARPDRSKRGLRCWQLLELRRPLSWDRLPQLHFDLLPLVLGAPPTEHRVSVDPVG